ncbi:MAG: helix-turn-helix domain-containing protein [Vulcanimicrobiaceae bacterium]
MERLNDLATFDAADHLKTKAAVAHFLARAIGTNDPDFIVYAFEAAARSKGAAKIKGGKALYRSLAKSSATLHDTMQRFGFESVLRLSPIPARRPSARKPRAAAHASRRRKVSRA